ncbi:CaiB/BaiF CoA transferase family protein [Sphingomonas sp. ID0503]|uniref:CaiB/BaiF CoA transferase family protein n=1 Tax=Sphingomonas sp. ID0503 TaxID=3399691 RepID=UPI003AFACAC7
MPVATSGPLSGLRVIEFVSIGPGPHCAMLLADLGADVLRIDRPGGNGWPNPIVDRGRAVAPTDIRSEAGRLFCLDAAAHADVLIEGFRPGVMERLGLGPEVVMNRNERLVYGRMTGWGQTGPWARTAGHDINYIALTGALAAIGKPGEPATIPLNLIGDFGGGSMFLAFGIVAALWERERSGRGQVVDAAIVDGVASLMTMFAGLIPSGQISLKREENVLGGAAPFYRSYLCRDGAEMAVGPLEPKFFSELLSKLGLEAHQDDQFRPERWDALAASLQRAFLSQDQAHWSALFAGSDACVVPVLHLVDAPAHPHHAARKTFVTKEGLTQAAPAPRFSRTPGTLRDGGDALAMIAAWKRADGEPVA